MSQAKVLVIDDSSAVRAHVEGILRAQKEIGQVLAAKDGIEGFKLLVGGSDGPIDLVLCDLVMPNLDGFRFLALKAARPEFKEVPVIMLTGEEDVKAKVRVLHEGASDYLTKPFDAQELVARVRVHLKIKLLQDELVKKNHRLEELTRTDELTGLNNRRAFMEALHTEFRRSARYGTAVAFAMVDIDHFKRVNDTFGHPIGDRALVTVAHVLQQVVRVQDVLGRYGGEEFAIVMPHTDLKGGELAGERVRKQVEQTPVRLPSGPLMLTVSMGVVHFPRGDVERVEELVELADQALYRAKSEGRNRVCVAPGAT